MAKRSLFLGLFLFPGPFLHAYAHAGSLSAAAGAQVSSPTRMIECESANDACTQPNAHYNIIWAFDGTEGTANSPNGSTGTRLTIEKFDGQTIVVRRFDRAGASAGLSGLYTGTVEGKHITGTVKWSWLDHPGFPASGTWSAIIQDQPSSQSAPDATAGNGSSAVIPPRLLECEGVGRCNGSWIINGSEGTATWFAQTPVRAKLTVVRSEPDDILIRRTDTSDGNSAVYSGKRHGDQISGTVIWSSPDHPGGASGTWSASVPQTVCETQANLTSADAQRIGQNALMFQREHDALDCYIVAAKTGDPMAQTAVGLLLYQGHEGIPQDYKQALFWLRKAADQGIYAAQKTVADMYMLGQGTAPDPNLSNFYAAKASEQKREWERNQDRADRAAASRANMLTGFVMGAVFGALLFY
jgi:hypothetical protein